MIELTMALLLALTPATANDKLEPVSSPLVSVVPISPIVINIVEDGWWITRGANHLVVDDAILASVSFSRKKLKDSWKVALLVRVKIASRAYLQSVDMLKIELFDGNGKKLAKEVWSQIFVGLELGPSSASSSKYLTMEYVLSQWHLEDLFRDDLRPYVEVTLAEYE